MLDVEHIGMLSEHIPCSWPSKEVEARKDMQPYCSSRDMIVNIASIAMKDRRKLIPATLQDKVLKQLHLNHMDTEKKRLLAH